MDMPHSHLITVLTALDREKAGEQAKVRASRLNHNAKAVELTKILRQREAIEKITNILTSYEKLAAMENQGSEKILS